MSHHLSPMPQASASASPSGGTRGGLGGISGSPSPTTAGPAAASSTGYGGPSGSSYGGVAGAPGYGGSVGNSGHYGDTKTMPPPAGPSGSTTRASGMPAKRGPVLIATNTVTTKDGLTVRARIDPTLSVSDVVKQLCLNLKIPDNFTNLALRDSADDELVTDDNLRKKIEDKAALKLTSSPLAEAEDTINKLRLRDEKTLRFCLFNLQRHIKEDQFATKFLEQDGLRELCGVIVVSGGNTLAYALTALSNLLDLPFGWSNLTPQFIYKIVQILASPNNLVNVCRPATLILKKLVEADVMNGTNVASSSTNEKGHAAQPAPGSVYRFGFDVVYEQMRHERNLLEIVVGRLGGGESMMVLYSMTLLNSLLSHATPTHWVELTSSLERLNASRAVIRLMSSHTIEDLTNSILDYQGNMIRVLFFKKTRRVLVNSDFHEESGGGDAEQEAMLEYIWRSGKLEVDDGRTGQANGYGSSGQSNRGKGSMRDLVKWRKLGFASEDMRREFDQTGMLGLECLRHFVQADPSRFSQLVLEQNSRAAERRCPIAKASNEVVEILSDHWSIFAPGYSTSTTFQPFFLSFYRVHTLALQFFLRMWSDSGATAASDFPRVASLVRSQVKYALRSETETPWHEVEQQFLESEYRAVRDRQMKELEKEDDLLNKVPVRNLRAKLYKESYEFIRQQRIQCLIQGAWFVNGVPVSANQSNSTAAAVQRRQSRPWRYMRLDRNLKVIHFCDSAVKFPVRSGFEDLPERIDVSMIGEIAIHTCALPQGVNIALPGISGQMQSMTAASTELAPATASPMSFSLMSVKGGESLGDHVATDPSRWSDWTDGLNMLRREGGHVATSETAGFVHSLTEIGLKIKLLDLSGEKVDIPSSLMPGSPPADTHFFFSDL